MKFLSYLSLATVALLSISGFAKKPLDHDAFDTWQKLRNYSISNNGVWESFAVEPQEGDATLFFHSNKSGKDIIIDRGYNPSFSADSKWAVALVKPLFKDSRQARIDGKKDLKAPQDSLALINLETGKVERIPNVRSYKIGEKGGSWVAYQSVDTI